jgi:hypothetical protein
VGLNFSKPEIVPVMNALRGILAERHGQLVSRNGNHCGVSERFSLLSRRKKMVLAALW